MISSDGGAVDGATPPLSKTAYVLQRIREDIAAGKILPGQPLRQADIAARFGVSPTPVREALRLLEADGTITYSPHRGATVTELSSEAVRDLYLLRAEVEGLATQLAVERMDDEHLARIRAAHEQLAGTRGSGDAADLSRQNRDLHFTIYDRGSALIADHLRGIWTMLPPRVTLWQVPEEARRLIEQHEGIVEAIGRRDATLARERMFEHIMTAEEIRQRRGGEARPG